MRSYELTLTSQPVESFRCQKAANSVDLDLAKKLTHHFRISADLESPYNVGLIVGASGSGKTTLAKHVFGDFSELLDPNRPVIEQFPKEYSYEQCSAALVGAGLAQVPCWVRPAGTLSNGQKARAEIALQLASGVCIQSSTTAPGATRLAARFMPSNGLKRLPRLLVRHAGNRLQGKRTGC